MTTRFGRVAFSVPSLVFLIGSSVAQAQLYGTGGTVSASEEINICTFSFSCADKCDSLLEAECQQQGPSFCNPGDYFVSATYGGLLSSTCPTNYGPLGCNDPNNPSRVWIKGSLSCSGRCNVLCEAPPPCECTFDFDCESLYGPPEFGTWDCQFCQCILTNSPLVLYLPDYDSSGGGNQSWWKKGFCGPESPRVCLDWSGDGNTTCTAWLEPGSGIAFLVSLSDDDQLRLLGGESVRAEPWRHFFGNVTEGPQGDHPYQNGFAALGAHCGQDTAASSEIDLTTCGSSLYAWDDLNGDGDIALDELLGFQELGIASLGNPRRTGKKDKCGNTFRFESNAICSEGRCGKVLDVFFERR